MIKTLTLAGTMLAGLTWNAMALPVVTGPAGASSTPPALQNVDYRRCWYEDGARVCRWVYAYNDDDYDGYYDGYWGGPSIGFSFGGGGGHFGGGHFGGHFGGHGGHGRR